MANKKNNEEVIDTMETNENKPKRVRRSFEEVKAAKLTEIDKKLSDLREQLGKMEIKRKEIEASHPKQRTSRKSEATKLKEAAAGSGLSAEELQKAIEAFKANQQ